MGARPSGRRAITGGEPRGDPSGARSMRTRCPRRADQSYLIAAANRLAAAAPSGSCRSPGVPDVARERARTAAPICSNEIDAQTGDHGLSVVFVQTVEHEAVVEQSRHLEEHRTSHSEIHLGTCLGDCIGGCQELIERWTYGAGRHTGSLAVRSVPAKLTSGPPERRPPGAGVVLPGHGQDRRRSRPRWDERDSWPTGRTARTPRGEPLVPLGVRGGFATHAHGRDRSLTGLLGQCRRSSCGRRRDAGAVSPLWSRSPVPEGVVGIAHGRSQVVTTARVFADRGTGDRACRRTIGSAVSRALPVDRTR